MSEGGDWGEGEIFVSRALDSTFLLFSGAGGVSEGGNWREGEITGFSHLANCMTYIATVYSSWMQRLVKASTGTVLHLLHVAAFVMISLALLALQHSCSVHTYMPHNVVPSKHTIYMYNLLLAAFAFSSSVK